jgi:hypothetical protein
MTEEKDLKKPLPPGDSKLCGCPEEKECDHYISNFQKYCKHNPGAPECKIFDI